MSAKKRVAAQIAKTPSPWPRRLVIVCGLAIAAGAFDRFAQSWIASPEIRLLIPEHGARWIHEHRPFDLRAWGPTREVVFFRKPVTVPKGIHSAVLTVRALRTCMVYWDRERVLVAAKADEWKQPKLVTLTDLTPGEHMLEVFVEDSFGPAALLLYCDALDLRTAAGWDESVFGEDWVPAITVDDIQQPAFARRLPTPLAALADSLWWLIPLFLAFWGALTRPTKQAEGRVLPTWWSASRCRWIVILAWFVLAGNNFGKVPDGLGYDVQAHVDYINFVLNRHELPDASDGWQMFQAPLFYVLAAVLDFGLIKFLSGAAALMWLRWLTLLCGIAQVQICFLAGRRVFPDREDLQSLTVFLGGMLPMNVYMSQTLGNEPLCGVLTALILLWGWDALREPAAAARPLPQWRLGLVFGLDMLTKMSALMMGPIISVVLAVVNRRRGLVPLAAAFARCFGTAAVVCGWYYVRNYLRFGKLLMGGWDPTRGLIWWQDPGYRTPWQMVSFGQSFLHPIHAGIYSIGDGFFSSLWLDGNLSGLDDRMPTVWNMTLLLATPWPALLLSIALAAGMLRGIWCRDAELRRSLQLAGGSLLLFLVAFLLLWLEVPAYSQAKASYTLGLTPAYAVLCVAGLDLLPPNRLIRSAVMAFVLCWSVLVYTAYFVC